MSEMKERDGGNRRREETGTQGSQGSRKIPRAPRAHSLSQVRTTFLRLVLSHVHSTLAFLCFFSCIISVLTPSVGASVVVASEAVFCFPRYIIPPHVVLSRTFLRETRCEGRLRFSSSKPCNGPVSTVSCRRRAKCETGRRGSNSEPRSSSGAASTAVLNATEPLQQCQSHLNSLPGARKCVSPLLPPSWLRCIPTSDST